MLSFVRLTIAAAVAVTLGYTWTVGQGGFLPTNRNLCELWANLPLPRYERCEFQYVLVALWIFAAVAAGAWLIFEICRYILKIQNRKHKLLAYWLLTSFFLSGSVVSIYILIRQYRDVPALSIKEAAKPPELPDFRRTTIDAIFRQNLRLTLRMIAERWSALPKIMIKLSEEEILDNLWSCFFKENRWVWQELEDLRTLNIPTSDLIGSGWVPKPKAEAWKLAIDDTLYDTLFVKMGWALQSDYRRQMDPLMQFYARIPLRSFPPSVIRTSVDRGSLTREEFLEWLEGPMLRTLPNTWFLYAEMRTQ